MPVRSRTSGRSTDVAGSPASWSGDMGGEQQRVDARQHGDRRRLDARLAQPLAQQLDERRRPVVGTVLDHPQRTGGRVGRRSGLDDLGDAAVVVAEEGPGAGDDLRRAAVVDLQRVRRGAREQLAVVDEERRIGAGVAVDALVVVPDAEHVEGRDGEQAQQEDVGRREVLELVDEEVPAGALHRAAERPVPEQRLDGRVDLLVEVDGPALGQPVAIGGEQLGEARRRRRATPRRRRGR